MSPEPMSPEIQSEILRQRARAVESAAGVGRVLLGGNSISALAPYLREWAVEQCTVPSASLDALVLVEHIDDLFGVEAVARKIGRSVPDRLVLVLTFLPSLAESLASAGSNVRAEVERVFIAKGWRKHPSTYSNASFETMGAETDSVIAVFEPVPVRAIESFPLEGLRSERDLHMDMLREPGVRSDAHASRYEWAAGFVRPGDRVLDAACGMGYGSHILARRSKLSAVVGIDSSDYAVSYATANYGSSLADFERGTLPEALDRYPDGFFDCIVSFETLEHVCDPEALIAGFHRVLAPGGRLLVSVPNDWADETGEDPNPHHLHVYDWDVLERQLGARLIVEESWQLIAGGCKQGDDRLWRPCARRFRKVDKRVASSTDAEWWLASAMRSPLEDVGVAYRETVHQDFSGTGHLVDFGAHYSRPWIVHSMVEIPYRLRCQERLGGLAWELLGQVSPGSPDAGAALAILGYRILGGEPGTSLSFEDWDAKTVRYLAQDSQGRPHVRRWQLSLSYLRGRLLFSRGRLIDASNAFASCVGIEVKEITPTLGTKVVDACFRLGLIRFITGDSELAREAWTAGLKRGVECIGSDWLEFVGNKAAPYEFSLNDAVEIADLVAQCGAALRATASERAVASLQLAAVNRATLRAGLARLTDDVISISSENRRLVDLLHSFAHDRDVAVQRALGSESNAALRGESLARTEQGLAIAERLAIERLGEISRLEMVLSEVTALAHQREEALRLEAEARKDVERLALERLEESQRLATALGDATAIAYSHQEGLRRETEAREVAERFAIERLAELERVAPLLEASNALAAERLVLLNREANVRAQLEKSIQCLQVDVSALSEAFQRAESLALSRLEELERVGVALEAVTRLAVDREDAEAQALLLRSELDAITASRWWRIGSPFRAARDWFHRKGGRSA